MGSLWGFLLIVRRAWLGEVGSGGAGDGAELIPGGVWGGDLIGPAEHGVGDLVSRRWPPYPVALVWWVLLSGFGGVGRLKHIAWLIRLFSF